MKKALHLLKGFRPTVSIPAAMLVHVGYRLEHLPTNWGLVIIIFILTGLTMLQNDYFDREHDLKKGKRFAYENPKFLLKFLVAGWTLTLLSAALYYPSQFIFLSLIAGIGFFYSFFRKITGLSHFTVAVLSASPLFLAEMYHSNQAVIWFSVAVFLGIYAREALKDVEDRVIDQGYKNTLLTAEVLEFNAVHENAAYIICFAAAVPIMAMPHGQPLVVLLYFLAICMLITSAVLLSPCKMTARGKQFFDAGMCVILIAFSI